MNTETERIEADVQQSRHRLNESLEELGSRLSPGQMLNEGIDIVQEQAGRLAVAAGRQIRDNPVPYALIGLGAVLLIASNLRSSRTDYELGSEELEHRRRYRTIEEARWATPRMPHETDEAYEERVHEAYASKLGLTQRAGEAAHEFKERVKTTVADIQQRASRFGGRLGRGFKDTRRRLGGAATRARQRVGDFASTTGERISHLASDAKHVAEEQAQRLGRTASEVRYKTQRFYDDNPLAAGAIALGAGALIGALTPLSRTERRALRGVADTAVRASADLAERGARAVDETVDRAVH